MENIISRNTGNTRNTRNTITRVRSTSESESESDYDVDVEMSSIFTPSDIDEINDYGYSSEYDPFLYPSTYAHHPTFAPFVFFDAATTFCKFIYTSFNTCINNSFRHIAGGLMLCKISINLFIHIFLFPRFNNISMLM